MTSNREMEPAFIQHHAGPLSLGGHTRIAPPVCTRRRARTKTSNWRCVAPTDSNPSQQQPEGVIPLDSDDNAFEAALSKGWDDLQLFDIEAGSKSKGLIETMDVPEKLEQVKKEKKELQHEQTEETEQLQDKVEDEKMVIQEGTVETELELEVKNGKTKKVVKKKKTTKSKTTKKDAKQKVKLSQVEIDNSEEWDKSPRWFCVQVKPGCEQSCAISVRNMAQSLETLQVQEVLVPSTKIMRLTKGGQSVKKEERFFPGYILVLMVMNRQSYADIRSVPNVQYFMGDPNRDKKKDQPFRPPVPLSDADIKTVFDKIREAEREKPEGKTDIRPGDTVKAISGPFQDRSGRVLEVKPDLNVVLVNLVLYGKETPTELEFDQVQVIQDDSLNDEHAEEENLSMTEKKKKKSSKDSKSDKGEKIKPYTAGVASAEDDLSLLLGEFDDDDEKSMETSLFESDKDDDFVEATQTKSKKDETKPQKAIDFSAEDDLDALLGGNNEDMWQPSPKKKERKFTSKDSLNDPLFPDVENEDDDLLSSFFDEIDEAMKREESEKEVEANADLSSFDLAVDYEDENDFDFKLKKGNNNGNDDEVFGDNDNDTFQEAEIGEDKLNK